MKDVLEERDDLKSEHVLPNIVAHFEDSSLPNLVGIVFGLLRGNKDGMKTENVFSLSTNIMICC